MTVQQVIRGNLIPSKVLLLLIEAALSLEDLLMCLPPIEALKLAVQIN